MTNPSNLDLARDKADSLRKEASDVRAAITANNITDASLIATLRGLADEREEKASEVMARGYRLHFYATQREQTAADVAGAMNGRVWSRDGLVRVYCGQMYLNITDALYNFINDNRSYTWISRASAYPVNEADTAKLTDTIHTAFEAWMKEQA